MKINNSESINLDRDDEILYAESDEPMSSINSKSSMNSKSSKDSKSSANSTKENPQLYLSEDDDPNALIVHD